MNRRNFLELMAFGGAGLLLPSKRFVFNWGTDVPPSLMLHSGNIEYLPELLPALAESFVPLTYKDWIEKLIRIDNYSSWIGQLFDREVEAVRQILSVEILDRLPLILSIDDVSTDWIRLEHLQIFETLLEHKMQAVVGVQPKVLPQENDRYWKPLRELHTAGWEIASHSINHPPLTQINRRTAAYEIFESCDRIEQAIGERPITLITPFGDSKAPDDTSPGNVQLYELAAEAGVRVLAGIQDGRRRTAPAVRAEIDARYDVPKIPEYVGRIPPHSDKIVTIFNLMHFNGDGYELG